VAGSELICDWVSVDFSLLLSESYIKLFAPIDTTLAVPFGVASETFIAVAFPSGVVLTLFTCPTVSPLESSTLAEARVVAGSLTWLSGWVTRELFDMLDMVCELVGGVLCMEL